MGDTPPAAESGWRRSSLPILTRISRGLRGSLGSRLLAEYEWVSRYAAETREVEIDFFAERCPLELWFRFWTEKPVSVVHLASDDGRGPVSRDFVVTEHRNGTNLELVVKPVKEEATRHVVIRLAFPDDDLRGRLETIRVVRETDADLELLHAGRRAADAGRRDEAIARLREYERYTTENPTASLWLWECYQAKGMHDEAEEEAVKMCLRGNSNTALEAYRAIQSARPPTPPEEIRALQAEAREWGIGRLHGVAVLRRQRRFTMGLNGLQLRRGHELVELRRPAAARLFRGIQFDLDPRERLIYTTLRILHPDGTVEVVPEEHFTIRDRENRNRFILVENDAAGFWILPDLAVGDVIDWRYDVVYQDLVVGGSPQCFSLDGPFHDYFPTLRGALEYATPSALPLEFVERNAETRRTDRTVGDRRITTFEGARFEPIRRGGFAPGSFHVSPMIACARSGIAWTDVAAQVRRLSLGDVEGDEGLPPPLLELIERDPREQALERAFYWVRDKIKYAAVQSGIARMGDRARARMIVEAGVGDCKDKSYLLARVCHELGIPWEILAVSARNGTVVDDLPADQFDHVFLRARQDGGWLYLDAANAGATFGSPPPHAQGFPALIVSDTPAILEIPADSAEHNAFTVSESFATFRDRQLVGEFRLVAKGNTARFADELWKTTSLQIEDDVRAGSEALDIFLPGSHTASYVRREDTSESSTFRVEGEHSRGALATMSGGDRSVCDLGWRIPPLPIAEWRSLQSSPMFVLPLVVQATIEVTLRGDVRRAVADVSRVAPRDDAVGRIAEEIVDEADVLTVRRRIAFKKRIFRGEEARSVPATFERMEQALRLVLVLDVGALDSAPRASAAAPAGG